MSEAFNTYPVLDYTLFSAIGYVGDPIQLEYNDGQDNYELKIEDPSFGTFNSTGRIKDPRCTWYPETHNLIIKKTSRFTSAYELFGKTGIVPVNGTIGIALSWISTGSDKRGVVPFGELTKLDSSCEIKGSYEFPMGELRGSLKLQTVLYLKDPGMPSSDETYFAQTTGTVLGILDQFELFIDGNGSIFPIVTVNAPGKPLWMVSFNDSADVFTDRFDNENVEIRLNQAHPDYELLNIGGSLSETPLFMEVLASALTVIVESTKESAGEEWTVLLRNGGDRGSIAEAVYHFVTKLQWDVSSPSKLASSIRSFLGRIQ